MIDIHCHILPGLDDGAKDLEMSLKMANAAVSDGITHILATPHHHNREYINSRVDVEKAVDQFQIELDKRHIDLIVFPGQEVRLHGEILDNFKQNDILCTDLNNTYMLVEFPSMDVPAYTDQVFFDLLSKGIRPIIVHPERNAVLMKDLNRLADFIDKGCYAQLTSSSLIGEFGSEVEEVSKQMIERGLVHMLASDAHRPDGARGFNLTAAFNKLEDLYGQQIAFDFKANAKSLINGDPLISDFEIKEKKKKKGLFNFFKK